MAKLRKLGRTADHRNHMLRNLTTSALKSGRITTTLQKAKEAQRITDRMITLGKRGDLHSRKQAISYLYDDEVVRLLFTEIAPRFENREGGYTRVLKLGQRRGDGAEMAILELVD